MPVFILSDSCSASTPF